VKADRECAREGGETLPKKSASLTGRKFSYFSLVIN